MGHFILRRTRRWTEGTKEGETGGERSWWSHLRIGRAQWEGPGFFLLKAQAQQVSPTVGLCQLSLVLPRVTKSPPTQPHRTHARTHITRDSGASVVSGHVHTLHQSDTKNEEKIINK